ncbi:MAG: FCD domain-containing protein [Chlorobiales bacterium]|nr:FCD domain-containing protein [Chlorobiales bacterium]
MEGNRSDHEARLRRMIEKGDLAPDHRLPPERTLAKNLGLSRAALRKSLALLESEGLIWRHVGRGTFVGARPEPGGVDTGHLAEVTSPAEIMEVRLVIEPKIAAMAAMRATRQEMKQMAKAVHRSETASGFEENEKWDLILHEIIARATNNHLLTALFKTTNELRRGENWGRMKEASLTPDRWQEYARQHHELVAAIEDRNAPLAEEIMRSHLESVRRNLLQGS